MAKKIIKKKKTQAEEDAEFLAFLQSDKGTKFLQDDKKILKIMKGVDKSLGLDI
ncbi:MAG TPA: hypothetical protein VMW66_05945 [Elusimicrobiales bacterium]|nr:hypothetical protein [Elusimicrobiales bacterium]